MGGLGIRTMHSKDKALLEKLEMKNTEGRRFVIGESSKRKTFKEGCRKLSAPRYDTSPPQDTTPDYFCLCVNFFIFFLNKKKKKKKTQKLAMGPPYHMDKVVKSCVLGWQNVISLQHLLKHLGY